MVDACSCGIVDFYDIAYQLPSPLPPPTPDKNYKPIFRMHQDARAVRGIQPKDSLRTPTGRENCLSIGVRLLPQSLEGSVRNQQSVHHYVHVYRLIQNSLHRFSYTVMHALTPLYHHVLISLLVAVCLVLRKMEYFTQRTLLFPVQRTHLCTAIVRNNFSTNGLYQALTPCCMKNHNFNSS